VAGIQNQALFWLTPTLDGSVHVRAAVEIRCNGRPVGERGARFSLGEPLRIRLRDRQWHIAASWSVPEEGHGPFAAMHDERRPAVGT
jgi:hypothetical protein